MSAAATATAPVRDRQFRGQRIEIDRVRDKPRLFRAGSRARKAKPSCLDGRVVNLLR
jgi:hypothetical protein